MSITDSSKRFTIRVIRKVANIGNRAFHKAIRISSRVENKASRILDGTDYSVRVSNTDPLEKVYYSNIPFVLPINPALPKVGQKASVVLLIPSLDGKSFYGGAATALVVAAKVALAKKRPLHILQTTKTGHPTELQQFFEREGIPIDVKKNVSISSVADRAYNIYGYLPMHPDDIFIASAWWDAYTLLDLPMKHKFIYLVQDFEPIFYNNSDLYVLAEDTYKKAGFIPLCNTKLMYDFMHERHYAGFEKHSYYFEPAVSRNLEVSKKRMPKGSKKKLFLYGRPNVHRNLFFTALNALDYTFKAGFLNPKEWELFMAGDDNLPNIKLSSGPTIQNMGKMSMEKYIEFSKSIDIAVSPMMAPHPNYPTLEFASVGAQVVTTRYANKTDLSNYSPNIIMCDIDTESMSGAIRAAGGRIAKSKRTNNSLINLPANWHEALDTVITDILNEL